MFSIPATESVPLRIDKYGVVRVGNSRIPIDTIVFYFHEGDSPEEIVSQFPSLSLDDVYLVIGFYLRHRDDVDSYLRQREREAEILRAEVERMCPQDGLRERLLARRESVET